MHRHNRFSLLSLFSFLVVWLSFFAYTTTSDANEGIIGGQVITDGEIVFYEEQAETTSSSIEKNDAITKGKDMIDKSKGHIPSLGENRDMIIFFGVSLLLVTLLIFFFSKVKGGMS